MNNILGIIISYVFIAIVIVLAKFFEKLGKEASRKFIHIALANWWFIAMFFFDNVILLSIVPLSFVVINYISYKKNLISVMERSEEDKDGLGTVYYALALLILSIYTFGIIKRPEIGLCSILIMGYGDGMAAIIGKNVESFKYTIGSTTKTLAGSATMLFITFVISAFFLCFAGVNLWGIKALVVAIIMTLVEAVSIKGTDNITVPLLASLLFTIMI